MKDTFHGGWSPLVVFTPNGGDAHCGQFFSYLFRGKAVLEIPLNHHFIDLGLLFVNCPRAFTVCASHITVRHPILDNHSLPCLRPFASKISFTDLFTLE